ncbi:MAG: hypothetical protein HY716_02790 [Planctomycetes bacterium]|nr:hypothetical protein [Planctomycetota bacterium]
MAIAKTKLSEISHRLERMRASIRSLFMMDGVSRAVLALGVFVIVTFSLDWLFILPAWFRLLLLLGGLGGFGWIAARRLVYPLSVRISDDDLAIFVERFYPELRDRLISAIQLARHAEDRVEDRVAGFNSPELVDALIDDAGRATQALDFNRVVVRQHVMKIATWAAVLVLALGIGAAARSDLAGIYLNRVFGGKAKWPQRTHLILLDFDPESRSRTVARGMDVTIAVKVKEDSVDPGKVVLRYKFDSGEEGEEVMAKVQDRYTHLFPHLSGPFELIIRGGDDESEPHYIKTENPPTLTETQAFFVYPDYIGLEDTPPERPQQGGNVEVPMHTQVKIVGFSNEDLAEARLIVGVKGKEKESAMVLEKDPAGKPRRIWGLFKVEDQYSEYQIQLKAVNQLENVDPIRYTVKGIPDQKPMVKVIEPPGDETITEICKRPIILHTEDDHGVAQVWMEARVIGSKTTDWQKMVFGPDENRPREYNRQVKKVESQYVLDVAPLGAKEGDYVEMRFMASDYKPEANVYVSRPYRLGVVSMAALEKQLQDAIDQIKKQLNSQENSQRLALELTMRTEQRLSGVDSLSVEQQGEIRGLAFRQQGIGEKLAQSARDVNRVRLRGLWNGVFDDRAATTLKNAIEALREAAGSVSEPNPNAYSPKASTLLHNASRANARERLQIFGAIQQLQGLVLESIRAAVRYLENWATYQEIVGYFRGLKSDVEGAKKEIIK